MSLIIWENKNFYRLSE